MQGLLLKDIYTLFSKTKFFLLLIGLFALLPGASISAFAIFYSVMLPMTALAYDEQTKWHQLAAMMPYSPQALVGSKYLLGLLAAVATSALAWLGQLFTAGSFTPAELAASLFDVEAVFYVCLLLCLALCFMMLNLPIMFYFGVEKGRLFNLLALVIVIVGISLFVSDESGWLRLVNTLGDQNMYILLLAAAAVALVGNILSIMLSVWLYKRKSLQEGHL